MNNDHEDWRARASKFEHHILCSVDTQMWYVAQSCREIVYPDLQNMNVQDFLQENAGLLWIYKRWGQAAQSTVRAMVLQTI